MPEARPKDSGPILIVEGSAAARARLCNELATRHEITLAQTLLVARVRAEELPPAAAVVTAEQASPAELDLVHWLAQRRVPILAIIAHDGQRRRLLSSGAALALVRPPAEDEAATRRHIARVAAWLDAVVREPPESLRPHTTQAPRLTLTPSRSSRLPRTTLNAASQLPSRTTTQPTRVRSYSVRAPAPASVAIDSGNLVVCIGISTGGPEALEHLFRKLPASMPPIVIVQHMPVGFTAPLARRLDNVSAMTVREAAGDETLYSGLAFIAPGGVHLRLRRQGFHAVTELVDAPPVDRHRPSVNVLFESAAEVLGAQAIGVVMTGMGDDGTRGLLAMKARGAITVAQDAPGCAVFGMPQRAILAGAADHVVALEGMAARLIELSNARDFAPLA